LTKLLYSAHHIHEKKKFINAFVQKFKKIDIHDWLVQRNIKCQCEKEVSVVCYVTRFGQVTAEYISLSKRESSYFICNKLLNMIMQMDQDNLYHCHRRYCIKLVSCHRGPGISWFAHYCNYPNAHLSYMTVRTSLVHGIHHRLLVRCECQRDLMKVLRAFLQRTVWEVGLQQQTATSAMQWFYWRLKTTV